ncbi:MAG: nitrite reductase, copper-containing [Chloroflexi bacterium]|nr:nitrite reductase, copper-containing [Chloroflexota bacterium]
MVRYSKSAAILSLALILAIATACTTSQAQGEDAKLPTRVEVAAIVAPPQVPPAITRKEPALVKVEMETTEVTKRLADGVEYGFWTFNSTVPGPFLRVREGDTVELTLKDSPQARTAHSIDLHAVTGPGGGAVLTQVSPGQAKTFRFRALNPGLYVYHCATSLIPQHISNGMYGLILVQPKAGLPKVDKEFYVMQGELYTEDGRNSKGLQTFSLQKMVDENADYVVFNGEVGSITGDKALQASLGDRVRIFFGVGGPNLTSSFHVIGEIFDEAHQEGASEATRNIQTTLVPPGGAAWVDFTVNVPGTYTLVDHSLGRLLKGAAGQLVVSGADQPHIFSPVGDNVPAGDH